MGNHELDKMWSSQKMFNSNFVDFNNLNFDTKQSMTKEYVLHLLSEANSLLESVNWKMHHKKIKKVNREDVVLEIIDVWKYLLSICLLWDVTPEEFCRVFDEKSSLVEQKFLQEFSEIDGRKIAICDIDGVLSDYPKTFLKFVEDQERYHNKEFSIDCSKIDDIDLYKYFKGVIRQDLLKAYKHRYRISGKSREEEVTEGAKEFLLSLKDNGYYIVLLTSRPFDTYKSLYLDTYVWLKSNGLVFDMLINDSKKRDKIGELLKKSHVEFVVDDDPRLISNMESLDNLNKIYVLDRSYNRQVKESDKIVRIKSLSDIIL